MGLYDEIQRIRSGRPPGERKEFTRNGWWRPKKVGRESFRFYRHTNADGVKKLFWTRLCHWPNGEKSPFPCTGNACKTCETSNTLRADPLNRDAGWNIRQITQYHFVLVNPAMPEQFLVYEASEAAVKVILPGIAKEAGWMGGWPVAPDMANPTDVTRYQTELKDLGDKADQACDTICGPKGRDVMLTIDPKGQGVGITAVDVFRVPGKVLPFEENEGVPNPAEVRARMDERQTRKENG